MESARVRLGDRWTRSGDVVVTGRPFLDDECLDASAFAAHVAGTGAEAFCRAVADLNGFFGVLRETEDAVVAAVDRIRSAPLYYAVADGELYLSDDAHWLATVVDADDSDPTVAAEYLLTGCVTGSDTLAPGVRQLQSGELLVATAASDATASDGVDVQRQRYYRYERDDPPERADTDRLVDAYWDALDGAFGRLVEHADGRPIAISLSAGHDSRLVALALQRQEYEDLVAFTYGAAADEATTSERVADDLGIPWEFVAIDQDEVADWYHSAARRAFDRDAGWLASAPNYGLALAMRKLRRQGRLPEDAVVVTGDGAHTTGEHVPTRFRGRDRISRDLFVETLLDANYDAWGWDRAAHGDELGTRVLEAVGDRFRGDDEPFERAVAAYEEWDWAERQSKRIRSNAVYEHVGYDWWFPLWDAECVAFWRDVPTDRRVDKRFHDEFVERAYEAASTLDDPSATFPSGSDSLASVKQRVERVPVLGSLARRAYRRLQSPPNRYPDDPYLGMMSEEQFAAIVAAGADRTVPSHVEFHALGLLDRVAYDPAGPAESVDPVRVRPFVEER
ncbi:asparagine synthase-related protein [Halomarina salina]|uniref:Asparagine synthase-related protein n=1 Tax=Halomarina salina TaxID=1872699 RepID=A0ABD5RPB9_9EURY|nr:asparagine synthase C-terminal domain-containing protein [Halomarina salina]